MALNGLGRETVDDAFERLFNEVSSRSAAPLPFVPQFPAFAARSPLQAPQMASPASVVPMQASPLVVKRPAPAPSPVGRSEAPPMPILYESPTIQRRPTPVFSATAAQPPEMSPAPQPPSRKPRARKLPEPTVDTHTYGAASGEEDQPDLLSYADDAADEDYAAPQNDDDDEDDDEHEHKNRGGNRQPSEWSQSSTTSQSRRPLYTKVIRNSVAPNMPDDILLHPYWNYYPLSPATSNWTFEDEWLFACNVVNKDYKFSFPELRDHPRMRGRIDYSGFCLYARVNRHRLNRLAHLCEFYSLHNRVPTIPECKSLPLFSKKLSKRFKKLQVEDEYVSDDEATKNEKLPSLKALDQPFTSLAEYLFPTRSTTKRRTRSKAAKPDNSAMMIEAPPQSPGAPSQALADGDVADGDVAPLDTKDAKSDIVAQLEPPNKESGAPARVGRKRKRADNVADREEPTTTNEQGVCVWYFLRQKAIKRSSTGPPPVFFRGMAPSCDAEFQQFVQGTTRKRIDFENIKSASARQAQASPSTRPARPAPESILSPELVLDYETGEIQLETLSALQQVPPLRKFLDQEIIDEGTEVSVVNQRAFVTSLGKIRQFGQLYSTLAEWFESVAKPNPVKVNRRDKERMRSIGFDFPIATIQDVLRSYYLLSRWGTPTFLKRNRAAVLAYEQRANGRDRQDLLILNAQWQVNNATLAPNGRKKRPFRDGRSADDVQISDTDDSQDENVGEKPHVADYPPPKRVYRRRESKKSNTDSGLLESPPPSEESNIIDPEQLERELGLEGEARVDSPSAKKAGVPRQRPILKKVGQRHQKKDDASMDELFANIPLYTVEQLESANAELHSVATLLD